jgi:predicted ATPase
MGEGCQRGEGDDGSGLAIAAGARDLWILRQLLERAASWFEVSVEILAI